MPTIKPLLFALLSLVLANSLVAAPQARTALVIGNSQYENSGYLKNPVNDARAIAKQLEVLEFEVILTLDADQEAMDKAIDVFGSQLASRKGVGLFFYAGHGMQSQGRNFLIPIKAKLDKETDLKYQAVNFNKVLDEMNFAGNGINIAILDACRDNPLSRSWSRGTERGLARAESTGDGTLIVYSTSPGETAADGNGVHSPFAEALLENLPKPDLHLSELFNDVGLSVQNKTRKHGKKQTPWMSSSPLPKIYLASGSIQPNPIPASQPVSGKGDLEISTVPSGASLFLEGGYLGQAPQTLKVLKAGRYQIEARKEGYESAQSQVQVQSGKLNRITLTLDSPLAYLTVQTTPSHAKVKILDIVPPYKDGIKLSPGKHQLEVSAEGYETESRWIQVSSGSHYESVQLAAKKNDALSSLGLEFVTIPAGSFQMGSNDGDADEKPIHEVTVPSFKLMKYEVTQEQWQAVMGSNPSNFKDCVANCPVEQVSWNDIQYFIKKLNAKTGLSFRLPSEAEWEYAARAGKTTIYSWGNDIGSNNANCWGCGSQWDRSRTAPVGSFNPNAFGLHDMHGNVREWVQDCFKRNYLGTPNDGSAWEDGDCEYRGLRGGSWRDSPPFLGTLDRQMNNPVARSNNYGFRLVQGP